VSGWDAGTCRPDQTERIFGFVRDMKPEPLSSAALSSALKKPCQNWKPDTALTCHCREGRQRQPFWVASTAEVAVLAFLALAAEQDRILVTHDRQTMPGHFAEFLMSGRSRPGVFLVSQHASIGEVIDALVLIWAASDATEWKNRIVNIPEP
jgi:hypothetical protein